MQTVSRSPYLDLLSCRIVCISSCSRLTIMELMFFCSVTQAFTFFMTFLLSEQISFLLFFSSSNCLTTDLLPPIVLYTKLNSKTKKTNLGCLSQVMDWIDLSSLNSSLFFFRSTSFSAFKFLILDRYWSSCSLSVWFCSCKQLMVQCSWAVSVLRSSFYNTTVLQKKN